MERTAGAAVADKYRLVRRLGDGGFGEVWLADEPAHERQVAIKFLKLVNDVARRRFLREAEALRRLTHANCVRVFDFGVAGHTPYLVTAFHVGETLDEWLALQPSMADKLVVARGLAAAVAHAHARQIVHRDIKPANVIVERDDALGPRAILLDFGVAKLVGLKQTDITKTGEVIGTPGFMSPEQLRGTAVGRPSDIYSFGALLFEIFAGEPPFRSNSQLELAMCHLTKSPPPLPQTVDDRFADLIARMLQKDPASRPKIGDVVDVLHGRASPKPPPAREVVRSKPERRATPIWPFVVGTCVLVVVLAGRIGGDDDPPPMLQRVSPQSTALLKSTDTGAESVNVGAPADLETPPTRPDRAAMGEAEVRWLLTTKGDKVGVRIPRSYDPDEPAPILLMLHDVLQFPTDMLTIDALNDACDRYGLVLIAPDDNLDVKATWIGDGDVRMMNRAIRAVGEEVQIDPRRIYVIGHGNGGFGAQRLVCEIDGVVAMAHTSHRLGGDGGGYCPPKRDVPTMLVSMVDDPTNPIAAVPDCLGQRKWSLDRHEKVLYRAHGCRNTYRDGADVCQTLDCDVPLRICHPEGGRDWGSMRQRVATNNPVLCNSPAGSFDFVTSILAFFDEVAPIIPPADEP